MRARHEYLGGARAGVLGEGVGEEGVTTVLTVRSGRRTLANLEGERCRGDKLFNRHPGWVGKVCRLSANWRPGQSQNRPFSCAAASALGAGAQAMATKGHLIPTARRLPAIKSILMVASGKGGVGKSTVTGTPTTTNSVPSQCSTGAAAGWQKGRHTRCRHTRADHSSHAQPKQRADGDG